ncbi:MAG: sulfurtransferase [Gammaproteobacteria bacterium]|nr:sulfurtransferase [Gammaproteobacteria bacterium]|tara:strand:- start:156581 stop:156904 length:324 start_codon:yes stop_codon:yes gene_type:complete
MHEKTPTEVKLLLDSNDGKLLVLDVREQWEYDICHIDGSMHIPMGQLVERIDDLKKNDTIVVVCHHGIRSRIVGKHLDSCGFKNIINLIGGVDRWSKEIDLNMKKYV